MWVCVYVCVFMCVYVWTHMSSQVYECSWRPEGIRSSVTRVTGNCEPPDVGAGDQTTAPLQAEQGLSATGLPTRPSVVEFLSRMYKILIVIQSPELKKKLRNYVLSFKEQQWQSFEEPRWMTMCVRTTLSNAGWPHCWWEGHNHGHTMCLSLLPFTHSFTT